MLAAAPVLLVQGSRVRRRVERLPEAPGVDGQVGSGGDVLEVLVVGDSVAAGVIPKDQAESLVIVCGVFIHPAAADNKKIYDYNYEATKLAIKNAMTGKPTADEMIAGKDKASHPFKGF